MVVVKLSRVERWISHVRLACSHCKRPAHANYRTATNLAFCAGCWCRFALVQWAEKQYHDEHMALCFPRFAQSIGCAQDETTSNLKYWLRFAVQASDEEIVQAYEAHNLAQEGI